MSFKSAVMRILVGRDCDRCGRTSAQCRCGLPVMRVNNYEGPMNLGLDDSEIDPRELFDPDNLREGYRRLCEEGL